MTTQTRMRTSFPEQPCPIRDSRPCEASCAWAMARSGWIALDDTLDGEARLVPYRGAPLDESNAPICAVPVIAVALDRLARRREREPRR